MITATRHRKLMQCLLGGLFLLSGSGDLFASSSLIRHCQGSGPVVYLVGGGPAFTTWHLSPVQQRLRTHYTVCRWDMRGVGENAGHMLHEDQPALEQWLQDMAQMLPDEPVILWGHSWGALQVLLFARAYPARVRHFILSNPVDPALHSLEHIEQKRYAHPDGDHGLQLEDIGTPTETLYILRSKIASYFIDARQGWAYANQFHEKDTNNRLNVRIWEEYRHDPVTAQQVLRLQDKFLGAIYCRHDVLQPEALDEYRRLLPAKPHVVLDDCAHFPWEENPPDYFAALNKLFELRRE